MQPLVAGMYEWVDVRVVRVVPRSMDMSYCCNSLLLVELLCLFPRFLLPFSNSGQCKGMFLQISLVSGVGYNLNYLNYYYFQYFQPRCDSMKLKIKFPWPKVWFKGIFFGHPSTWGIIATDAFHVGQDRFCADTRYRLSGLPAC